VRSGHASPEIIIVHARQVVMDQRVGVNALHSAGQRESRGRFTAAAFSGG